jgi:diacylglycerol kinase (ATP)
MHRRIIYIINPIAGTRTKNGLQQFIEEETKRKKIPFKIFPSVESGDYSFLSPIIKEEKITDVVIAGGDGTISQVVGSLLNEDLDFGVIPCGSGNGLAMTAGISKHPAKALDIVFAGKASAIDGFMVNEHFACMLCGVGFDAKVAHDFAKQTKRGLNTYIKQVLRNFISAKTYHFDVQLKNKKFEADAFFISIANSNQFGNNFTIAPKASLVDGMLDVVIIASSGRIKMIIQTIKQVAGWNRLTTETLVKEKQGVIYFQTNKISLINHDEAPMHIDGDPAETPREIKIEIMKKCFRLIQPL